MFHPETPVVSAAGMQTSPQGVAFSVINISHPSPNDILMGRGGGTNLHPGNLNYRRIIDSFKPDYSASPKAGKFKYACEVVDMIRNMSPPGRFLKKDANTNLYFDVGEKAAREKTSQCLREGQPKLMKQLGIQKGPKVPSSEEQALPPGTNRTRMKREMDEGASSQLMNGANTPLDSMGVSMGATGSGKFVNNTNAFAPPASQYTDDSYYRRDIHSQEPPPQAGMYNERTGGYGFSAANMVPGSVPGIPGSQFAGGGAPLGTTVQKHDPNYPSAPNEMSFQGFSNDNVYFPVPAKGATGLRQEVREIGVQPVRRLKASNSQGTKAMNTFVNGGPSAPVNRETSWMHLPDEPLSQHVVDNLQDDNFYPTAMAGFDKHAPFPSDFQNFNRGLFVSPWDADHVTGGGGHNAMAGAGPSAPKMPVGLYQQSSIVAPMPGGLSTMTSIGAVAGASVGDLGVPLPRDVFEREQSSPGLGRTGSVGSALFRSAISNSGRSIGGGAGLLSEINDEESSRDDDDDDGGGDDDDSVVDDEEGKGIGEDGRKGGAGGAGEGLAGKGKVLRGVSEGFSHMMR